MEFDFAVLDRRIEKRFDTRQAFAAALDLSAEKFDRILNGQTSFTFSEIIKAAELLDIPGDEIITYFFTPKVR